MFILRRQTKENLRKQYLVRDEKGFGLLEALISAILLAIMIATSVTVTNKYQALNYRSSLRQAIAQTIDEDLTEIRLELENYLYQPKPNPWELVMLQTKIVSNLKGAWEHAIEWRGWQQIIQQSSNLVLLVLIVKHIRFLKD